jgi:hypothetical protein
MLHFYLFALGFSLASNLQIDYFCRHFVVLNAGLRFELVILLQFEDGGLGA